MTQVATIDLPARRVRPRVAKRCALAAVALFHVTAGYAEDFSILYHERLASWSEGPDAADKSSALQAAKPADDSILSFTAFDRPFRVRLERNDLLLRRLPPDALRALRGVDVYRGDLVDIPGSWVRLTRHEGQLTGVIFDGAELFAIDAPARVARYLKSTLPAAGSAPIIFRWRDTTGALTDELQLRVGTAPNGGLTALAATAPVLDPGRQLDLGLVADSDFSLLEGAGVAAGMLSRANIVDGIFIAQLGLHVNVAELVVLDAQTDPFTAAEPRALLDELEAYRATTPTQRVQDLTHLLTGREFAAAGQGPQTVGIANLAAVCDERLGTGLTRASFGVTGDALIMAHELGHNFGAPHDAELGPCENESTSYIMARTLNGGREFSACSIQQMQPQLASSCLDLIAPGDVEIRMSNAPPDALIGRDFELDVVVDNPSLMTAYGLEVTAVGSDLDVIALSAAPEESFTCSILVSGPVCRRTMLPAGGSTTLRIVARTTAIAPATLQVSVRTLNDATTANNVASHTFAAQPMLQMDVAFAAASNLVRLGQAVEYTATVRNTGNVTATNAEALIQIPPRALNVVSLSSAVGPCTLDPFGQYRCALGALAPNATQSLSLQLRAVDAVPEYMLGYVEGTIAIEAMADDPVYDRTRSIEQKHVTVVEAVADLSTTVSSEPQLELNAAGELVLTVANLGPEVANDVSFQFNHLHHELLDTAIVSNVGACTIADQSALRFTCDVPSLAAGESLVVTIRATPSEVGQFRFFGGASARAFDPVFLNDGVDTYYTVTGPPTPPPPPPTPEPPTPPPSSGGSGNTGGVASGGGGGGAVDLSWLALLGVALVAAIANRRRRA
jgi:uncharacterized repeat protein (TIGR01451 family)